MSGFAQETTQNTEEEKDAFDLNPWKPKFSFENISEFRLDMDEQVPGLENKSKIGIKFLPFKKHAEVGKDDPFSAYIKVEDLALKVEGQKDATFKLDVGDIIAKINVYDFYIKMNSMTDFDFNQESLFSFAPMTSIKSDYYGFPSDDRALRKTILARGTDKKVGTLQFGYNIPQLELVLAVGATGTGNRNHAKFNDKNKPYNNTYTGMLYGTQLKWKPIKNELEKDSTTVIAETPIELNLGISGAFGNRRFNKSSITYGLKDKATIGSDLVVPTLSNTSVMASLGFQYKLGLTKINNKNTYLILQTGSDFGIDLFASDFSTFGHISKKANTPDDKDAVFNPAENKLGFNQDKKTNFAFSVGANIGFAWNKDEGEKESLSIKGKDSYSTRVFGEQDKKSGIGIGVNYGQNLYRPNSEKKLVKDIANKSFKTLNVEISTYEDNKKGILPGLGWIISGGIYDLLKEKPNVDDIITVLNHTNPEESAPSVAFVDAAKIGAALYVDYAIPLASISPKTYITPYVGTHILGSFKGSDKKLYLKAGLDLEKIVKFTTITLGWDSNDILAKKDKMGSVFLAFKVAFEE
ncbi:integrin-binding adhesin P66 family protein [Borrelia sp. BU AG58]|nr:integrin-binding adhesin P66 family protein [Borrelia sp. BU AG58]WKT13840.1 integrin-binding adhesin P66 family protein [Borrelia sp. BU AG58]